MSNAVETILGGLGTGSVVMTLDGHDEPINVAIKDTEGSWALGGRLEPWAGERLVRGIIAAKATLVVLHEQGESK